MNEMEREEFFSYESGITGLRISISCPKGIKIRRSELDKIWDYVISQIHKPDIIRDGEDFR